MIGIVRIALERPYTFIVLALLILIIGPLASGYLIEHGLLTTWGLVAATIALFGLLLAIRPAKPGIRIT